jgi:hypothetical protein
MTPKLGAHVVNCAGKDGGGMVSRPSLTRSLEIDVIWTISQETREVERLRAASPLEQEQGEPGADLSVEIQCNDGPA